MKKAIITAASESYSKQLLALLGSLKAYWPSHPPVIVYDLGLPREILEMLIERDVQVKKVPEFCSHWRKHFTWKIWCWNDVEAEIFLWMDAGMAVLKPLDELFTQIEATGYVIFPNYRLLEEEASVEACLGCGIDPSFRKYKSTIASGLIGFNKNCELMSGILETALELALVEKNIMATDSKHRHDQALISLLLYKNIETPAFLDGNIYLGGPSPILVPGQKVWSCRKSMKEDDIAQFTDYFLCKTEEFPSLPESSPSKVIGWMLGVIEYQIERIFGYDEEYIARFVLMRGLGKNGRNFMSLLLILKRFIINWRDNPRNNKDSESIYDGVRD